VPALFVSFDGKALDEKTPLHRSVQAMSRAGKRLFAAMGLETEGIINNIGLEQEMFLIPREAYFKRMDLQLTGRTVMGKDAPRGQEGSDHYMGPVNTAGPVINAMKEIQEECYKIGIPLITRHREVRASANSGRFPVPRTPRESRCTYVYPAWRREAP